MDANNPQETLKENDQILGLYHLLMEICTQVRKRKRVSYRS